MQILHRLSHSSRAPPWYAWVPLPPPQYPYPMDLADDVVHLDGFPGDAAHDAQDGCVIEEMSKTSARAVTGSLEGFADIDLTDELPGITTPALVIRGDADQMRLERAREMASLLGNGHRAIIAGVSRATQVAPQQSVAAWRDFIELKDDSLGRSF